MNVLVFNTSEIKILYAKRPFNGFQSKYMVVIVEKILTRIWLKNMLMFILIEYIYVQHFDKNFQIRSYIEETKIKVDNFFSN